MSFSARSVSLARRIKKLVDALLNTDATGRVWQALQWRLRYRLNRQVPTFDTLITQPHRLPLCRAVLAGGAVDSVLEVGCGRGPNLYILSRQNSQISLYGTDLSKVAIESARRELGNRAVGFARLSLGRVENLSDFRCQSIDVVLADAVLMYVPVGQVGQALSELLRVARSAVILSTWHFDSSDEDTTARYDEGTWIYDYRRLLQGRAQVDVAVERYPPGVWKDARWRHYGAVVTLRHRRNLGAQATNACPRH